MASRFGSSKAYALGIDEDTELFAYFQRHYAHFFPNLNQVHRTIFSRQTANLWKVKEHLWQELLVVRLLTIAPSRFATLCLWRYVCSPEPTAVGVSKERPPSSKTLSSNRPSTASGCTYRCAGRG